MSKTKTALNLASPPGGELSHVVELANTFHSVLDLSKLIELFSEKLLINVDHASLHFQNQDLDFEFLIGKKSRHTCSYRLLMASENLGEITVTRKTRFTEHETLQIEYMLSSLLPPLRNAILYQQALNAATKDPLTGLNNRLSYEQVIRREISLATRQTSPLSMVVLDIDNFKVINDQYGHLIGDCVLRDVAMCMQKEIRSSDIVFRYGGEEFVLLLSNTGKKGAMLLAERIRKAIEHQVYQYCDLALNVTASLGIACLQENETSSDLFSRADAALFEAKDSGRNRSVFKQ